MNAVPSPAPRRAPRLFPELLLMIGLPVLSIIVGTSLALTAYVKGFSPLPEPTAQVAPHH
jgi:hypothetical protein